MSTNFSPLAETFTVSSAFPQGCFISSVDLFFAYISSTETNPVEVHIVETLNGYPTQTIVENGMSMVSASVINSANILGTKSVKINFKFPQLVALQAGKEYAIVVMSNSLSYKLWTAIMGQPRIDNPAVLITQQPALGSMFKSQNGSTWTPEQSQDLTFNLNRAMFDINTLSTVTLVDAPINGYIVLPPNPFKITTGQTAVKVHHVNHGMAVGMLVTYNNSIDTQFNNTFTISTVVNSDYYVITAASQSTTNYVGGGAVTTEKVTRFDSIKIPSLPFGRDVGIQVSFKATSVAGVDSVETPLIPGELLTLQSNRYIQSSINKKSLLQGANSFTLKGILSSLNDAISPIINLNSVPLYLVGNRINSPSSTDVNYNIDGMNIVVGVSNVSFSSVTNMITVPSTTDYTKIVLGAWIKISDTGGSNDGLTGYISAIDTVGNTLTIVGSALVTQATRSATIIQYLSFISETQNGGTADSKLLTVPVTLSSMNTGFRVMVSFNIPATAELEMYYRVGLQSASTKLSKNSWTNALITYKKSVTNTDFIDYEYNITGLSNFDEFQFKFVFLSTTQIASPKIKNLRIISHA